MTKIKTYKPPDERMASSLDAKMAFVHFVTKKLFNKSLKGGMIIFSRF